MIQKKKHPWCKLQLKVGTYKIESVEQAMAQMEIFAAYLFCDIPYDRHDLDGILKMFCR